MAYNLTDTWRLNHRVNLLLLAALNGEQLAYLPNPRARNIADQFAHLHNMRLQWLEVQAPASAKQLRKIGKGAATVEALREAFDASTEAFAQVLDEAERTGKLRAAKHGVFAFFAYLIAHEAHHRGQILVHLKHAGMPVDRETAYGLWEWEKL